jgi:hypothetical protein
MAGPQLTTALALKVELGAAPVGEARAEAALGVGTAVLTPAKGVHHTVLIPVKYQATEAGEGFADTI